MYSVFFLKLLMSFNIIAESHELIIKNLDTTCCLFTEQINR